MRIRHEDPAKEMGKLETPRWTPPRGPPHPLCGHLLPEGRRGQSAASCSLAKILPSTPPQKIEGGRGHPHRPRAPAHREVPEPCPPSGPTRPPPPVPPPPPP